MKLTDIAKKPQLVKLTITDPEIVELYGEPLEFYTQDRQPLDLFIQLTSKDNSDQTKLLSLLKELILDEQGQPVIKDGLLLPAAVTTRAITLIMEQLGK